MGKFDVYTPSELNRVQEETVLVGSFYDMNDVMDIEPTPGSVFILSQSEPFDEEGEIQHERLLNWCNHYGMPLYQIHASGHVMPFQLKKAIKKIGPKKVVPVHTEKPGQFKKFVSNLPCKTEIPKKTVK